MPVPTYDKFIEPVLRYLSEHPDGAKAADVHEAAAVAIALSDEERLEVLPSGHQAVYKNRAGWAHDRLKRAGFSSSPRRGFWKLTPNGHRFAKAHPEPLSAEQILQIAESNKDVRLRDCGGSQDEGADLASPGGGPTASSPDDRLNAALQELRESTGRELLEVVGRGTPTFFEGLVLDLLLAMGYGAGRQDLKRVGNSGDGGIDGVISLDRLGLEKVYVQAKRWKNSNAVGREAVQAFYGALAGQRANKGVFITTSTFTTHAIEFARSVERIVLVDGARLAELMMEYAVGVSHKPIKIPKIDLDYFEEGAS